MIKRFLNWLSGKKEDKKPVKSLSPEQLAIWARFDEIVKDAPPAPLDEREIEKLVYALQTNQRPMYGNNGRDVYLSSTLSTVLAVFGEVSEENIREYGGKCKTLFAVWGKLAKAQEHDDLERIRRTMDQVLNQDKGAAE